MASRRRSKKSAREIEQEKKRAAAKKKRVTKTNKPAAKKSAAKKSATKKSAAKKSATKKPVAKKSATKKRAAKKSAVKKPARRTRAEEKRLEERRARDRARRAREKKEQKKRDERAAERALARRRSARKTPEEKKRAKKKAQSKKPKKAKVVEEPGKKKLEKMVSRGKWAERKIERDERKKLARKPSVRALANKVLNAFRVYLSNARDELLKSGVSSRFRVVLSPLHAVDAELSVSYPDWVNNVDDATQVLSLVEEALEQIPNVQWLTVGFALERKANDEGIRKSVEGYLPYQGAFRIVPDYMSTEETATSFQAAYEILRNVYNAHGMLPTGMLVRMAWSPDGKLWTHNDSERRKKSRPAFR